MSRFHRFSDQACATGSRDERGRRFRLAADPGESRLDNTGRLACGVHRFCANTGITRLLRCVRYDIHREWETAPAGDGDRCVACGTHRRRASYTLVEVMVSLAVFFTMLYCIWSIFVGGLKSVQREESKTQSMENAILAYELIAYDLRQLCYYGYDHSQIQQHPPVSIEDRGHLLRLFKFNSMHWSENSNKADIRLVNWTVTPTPVDGCKVLQRNGKIYPSIRLAGIHFEFKQQTRFDGKPIYFLVVRILGWGDRERDHNLLVALFSLDPYNYRVLSPYWVEVPARLYPHQ